MLKLGAVERNVAVCWTMVIAGRYRAATAILRKSLDGKLLTRFSQKLAPLIGCWLVTLICAEETKCLERLG